MPAASIERVTPSDTSGTKSANAGEPNVVRTPAVRLRSLIAVGTPYSGDDPRARSDRGAARRASSGVSVTNAPTVVETVDRARVEVVLGQLERRHLAAAYELALLERRQVVQFGHRGDPSPARRSVAGSGSDGCSKATSGATTAEEAPSTSGSVEHVDLEGRLRDGDASTTTAPAMPAERRRPRAPTCRRTAWGWCRRRRRACP